VSILAVYGITALQFLVSLLIQVFVWRGLWRRHGQIPRQMALLFLIFAGPPILEFFVIGSWDLFVLGLAVAGTYIMSFPAAAAQSPTILIIDLLDRKGRLPADQIYKELNSRVQLTQDRIDDLKNDGLSKPSNEKFELSLPGRGLGWIFWQYRKVINLPIGEG
jgi:hypothetical protein